MADHDGHFDAEPVQGLVQQVGLMGGRPHRASGSVAVTVARPVEGDDRWCRATRSRMPLMTQSSPVTTLPWKSTTGGPLPFSR